MYVFGKMGRWEGGRALCKRNRKAKVWVDKVRKREHTAVEVSVTSRKRRHARAGPRDEVIIDNIRVALPVAVACDVATAAAPVVDDLLFIDVSKTRAALFLPVLSECSKAYIILKIVDTLDLGIPRLIIDIQIPKKADPTIRLHESTARMRVQALTDDGILDRHIAHVAIYRERLVPSPGHRYVIENHVRTLSDGDAVFARVARLAHPESYVSHDGVVRVRPGQSVPVHGDPVARRCLPRDVDVFGHDDAIGYIDRAADVEDHDAVGL